MNNTHRLIRAAGKRLLVNRAMRHLVWCLAAGAGALAGLVLVSRAFGLVIDWSLAPWLALGGSVVAAIGWTWFARPRQDAVARTVDERAQLRESLSTALLIEKQNDPWSRAVVETTEQRAAGVKLKQVLPIEAPKAWPVPVAAALALAIAWIAMPELDLFGTAKVAQEEKERQEEIRLARQELEATQQQLDDLLKKAGLEEALAKPDETDMQQAKSPEEIRQAMVKQLTAAAQKLQEQRNSLPMEQQRALNEALKQLRRPGDGPMQDVSRKLARGDIAGAQEALQKMAEQAAGMSAEEREAMQQQAQNLAEQLEQIAQNQAAAQESLAQALEQQGMSAEDAQKIAEQMAQQAGDPQAMQQALENAMKQLQNMTPEQQQQLKQMAAQLASSKDLEALKQCMSQMGESGGDQQQMNDAMAMLSQQLQELGMKEAECKACELSATEGMSQLQMMLAQCQGGQPGGQMLSGNQGKTGGLEAGNGGVPELGPTTRDTTEQFAVRKERSIGDQGDGPIIASTLVDGPQVIGESRAEFVQAVEAAAQVASEAIDSQQVPREREDLIKKYFGSLQDDGKKSEQKKEEEKD